MSSITVYHKTLLLIFTLSRRIALIMSSSIWFFSTHMVHIGLLCCWLTEQVWRQQSILSICDRATKPDKEKEKKSKSQNSGISSIYGRRSQLCKLNFQILHSGVMSLSLVLKHQGRQKTRVRCKAPYCGRVREKVGKEGDNPPKSLNSNPTSAQMKQMIGQQVMQLVSKHPLG